MSYLDNRELFMSLRRMGELRPNMVAPRQPFTVPPPPQATRVRNEVEEDGGLWMAGDGTYFATQAEAERHNQANEAMGYTGMPLQRVPPRPKTIIHRDMVPDRYTGEIGDYCYVTPTRRLYRKVGAQTRMGSPRWEEVGDIGRLEAEINRTMPRNGWENRVRRMQQERGARIEPWWGAHGSSELRSYWNFIKTWLWKRDTLRRLHAFYKVGTHVTVLDKDLCWLGRSGVIVQPEDGGVYNDAFCDVVYVKLHGGCIGERNYTIRCSIHRLKVLDATAGEIERRLWVRYIDQQEWGRAAQAVRESTPDTAATLDEKPTPVIEPVKIKPHRRLIV